ncbi:MAG: hypothetical protein LBS89_05220, partial [Zoogloeaceae bacterium]|jgi:hypothetical protein|nr:hypothetical protein [Zoogloeaceae bacterium]
VLSKLLKVTDGPANTLVITSLVDGSHVNASDLQIEFAIPTSVAPGDVAAWNTAIGGIGWTDTELNNGRIQAFNQLIADKTSAAVNFAGLTASDLDSYGANPGSGYSNWYSSNDNLNGIGDNDYAAAFANTATGGAAVQSGLNSLHTSDNIINAGSGDDVIVLSTGSLSNDTIKWTDFNQGTNTIVNFDTTAAGNLGDDWLDFTSYGARWLGAASLDQDGKVVGSLWDTANDLHGAHASGGSSYNQALPTVVSTPTAIFWEDYTLHTGDKYITLTRAYEETDTAVQDNVQHRSTLYKIELWTVNGNEADAYRDIIATEVRDSAQLIGYVDLGKYIDNGLGSIAAASNDILSHIDFIL